VVRYQVDRSQFLDNHGATLLVTLYDSSISSLLTSVYSSSSSAPSSAFPSPNGFEFLPWKFKKVPKNYFSNPQNLRQFIDYVKKLEGIKEDSDLRKNHFLKNGGAGVLQKFNGSPQLLVKASEAFEIRGIEVMHEGNRKGENEYARKGYWTSMDNQKRFMEDLAVHLGFMKHKSSDIGGVSYLEQWYSVPGGAVTQFGGSGLLRKHGGSMFTLLSAVYPEVDWLPWKFKILPVHSWKDTNILHKAVKFLEKELKIKAPDDWYRVTVAQITEHGLARFFEMNGGLKGVLGKVYPEVSWKSEFLIKGKGFKKSNQKWLIKLLEVSYLSLAPFHVIA